MRARLIAALLFLTAPAFAQGTPPDVIRTKDGGMMRGTIIEKVPGDHVEIQLPNGQTRSVPMSNVEYAGPASTDGSTPPPPEAPPPVARSNSAELEVSVARLELLSKQRGVTYYRKMGAGYGAGAGWVGGKNGGPVSVAFATANFERLCTAPCSASVPRGTYKLGLSLDDGAVVAIEDALDLRGRLRLEGTYESNANIRRAGWALGVASLIAGMAAALITKKDCGDGSVFGSDICTTSHPYAIPGMLVGGVGLTLGVLMTFVNDDVTIRATPVP